MSKSNTPPRPRQVTPAANQPGTLRQMLAALTLYLSIDDYLRAGDRDGVWGYCLDRVLPHRQGGAR